MAKDVSGIPNLLDHPLQGHASGRHAYVVLLCLLAVKESIDQDGDVYNSPRVEAG
jgi:hypothetical protein